MVIGHRSHIGHATQVAAYLLLKRSCTLTVEYRNRRDTDHKGIVYQVLDSLQGLRGTHTAHVDMVSEVELALADIYRHHRTCRNRTCSLAVLRRRDTLKARNIDHYEHLAKGHLRLLTLKHLNDTRDILPLELNLRAYLYDLRRNLSGLLLYHATLLLALLGAALATLSATCQALHLALYTLVAT